LRVLAHHRSDTLGMKVVQLCNALLRKRDWRDKSKLHVSR
jgi:hypothetical protein